MLSEGVIAKNPARLLRTPKAPQKLPRVPTAEQTNRLVDQVADNELHRPFSEREVLIFELLYGCGLRIGELAGLNIASQKPLCEPLPLSGFASDPSP